MPGQPCRRPDLCQRREHPAGEDPPPDEAQHEQEGHRHGRGATEDAREEEPVGGDPEQALGVVGDVAQQEQPHHGQQYGTGDENESGIAEGEFQARAES